MTGLAADAPRARPARLPAPAAAAPRARCSWSPSSLALAVGSLSLGLARTGRLEPADLPGPRPVRGRPAGRPRGAGPRRPAPRRGPPAGRRLPRRDRPARHGAPARRTSSSRTSGRGRSASAPSSSLWLGVALAVATTIAVALRSDRWLRLYKYTWAAAGLALLALTFVFGSEVNGSRLTLQVGPVQRPAVGAAQGHPGRLLRGLPGREPGPARRRPGPPGRPDHGAPAAVPRPDRGDAGPGPRHRRRPARPRAPRSSSTPSSSGLLFLATGRRDGRGAGAPPLRGGLRAAGARSSRTSRSGSPIWLDPWADPLGDGYQLIQALHAFARGGLLGTGLGAGLPEIGGRPPIPAVHTDFPLAAIGEELGMAGVAGRPRRLPRDRRAGAADRGRRRATTSGRSWRRGSRWSSGSRRRSSPAAT